MRSGVALLLAAALGLGACTPKPADDGRVTIRQEGGAAVGTLSQNLPERRPAFAEVMPGGEIISVMDMAGRGAIIKFSTHTPPEQVLAFYRGLAEKAGMHQTLNAGSEGSFLAAYEGPPGRGGVMSLSIEKGEAANTVSLTYGPLN
ncbi:MAG: hypothetical protein U1E50_18245 [Caulobacteraceae bacterium]